MKSSGDSPHHRLPPWRDSPHLGHPRPDRGSIKFIPFFILLIFIVIGVFVFLFKKSSLPQFSVSKSFSTDFAYDQRTFLPAVAQNKEKGEASPNLIILPHHLLASDIIAKGISLLTASPPKVLIILSPNHANTGQCDIVTSASSWNTPYGQVEVDTDHLGGLISSGAVCVDDSALAVEHGIAGLLPFIKYYLPSTKIVPLALKKNPDPVTFNTFIQEIITYSDSATVIASVDFSHGLSQKLSLLRDEKTQQLIKTFNYPEIQNLSAEYLDTPASLITILKTAQAKKGELKFLDHQDSSFYNQQAHSVTSYFLITSTFPSKSTPSPASVSRPGGTDNTFTLLFGGDVMLGRSVDTRIAKHADYSWPFRKITTTLASADLTVVNLESPFRSGCKPTDAGMIFCANPLSVEGLVSSGIDVVNLANNHIGNQGEKGIEETLFTLFKAGIGSIGGESPYLKTIKGVRFALLGFNDIPPHLPQITQATEKNIKEHVAKVRPDADVVIANFHWGNEYSGHSSRQEEMAKVAIDAGADVVIGHHPHWVQGVGEYKGKPIYYSLGNLVFDQMWSKETRQGLVVRLTFEGKNLVKQEQLPIEIFDYGQPVFTK